MDDDRRVDPEPEPVTASDDHGGIGLILALIVAAMLVGIVRPWDLVPGPRSAARGDVAPSAGGPVVGPAQDPTPAGTAPPPSAMVEDPYAALWTTCGSPSGWRAATIQQWAGRAGPIRSWIAIEPVAATGPLDPGIPFAPVATDAVTAIGFCSPLADSARPPVSARATLWALAGGGARLVDPPLVEPAQPSALGGLWQPPPELAVTLDGFDAWPAGRYVLEIRSPDGPFDRWLGIEIEDLRARPTPAPSPGPVASTTPGPPDGVATSPAASGDPPADPWVDPAVSGPPAGPGSPP
jgi:hypothetical protein